jgi:restriction system protein
MGGKVVIQAKRYRHTVGVSAVRDLYGTLQNEGASKGILVTTSGYGKASHDFANGKPIELLDGANLLYLLREHAGIEARIQAPDDWRDPEPDQAPLSDEQPATAPAQVPLRAGQNVALNDTPLTATISWRTGLHDLDASAILLDHSGKVRSDADFIFYNQPATLDGTIRYTAATPGEATSTETLHIALDTLHPDVHRIVAAVSVDGGRFADIHDLRITATTTSPAAEYVFQPAATTETALVCLEIYRRDGTWRLRAVGQGYNDGLAGLARDFGVDVA